MRFFRKSLVAALLLGSPLLAEASRWNPYQSVSLVPPSPPVVTADANGYTLCKTKAGVETRFLYDIRDRGILPHRAARLSRISWNIRA